MTCPTLLRFFGAGIPQNDFSCCHSEEALATEESIIFTGLFGWSLRVTVRILLCYTYHFNSKCQVKFAFLWILRLTAQNDFLVVILKER
jgi:hypothetical protein